MRIKFFTILQGLTALVIAGIAAYFSVYGISKLYSGAVQDVILMAASLEIGKLIAASWLYRNYKKKTQMLIGYFSIALLGLMFVTSAGIYGFLTAAYQGSTIELQTQQTQIDLLEEQYQQMSIDKERLIMEKAAFETSRDQELTGMTFSDTTKYYDALQRRNILNRYKPLVDEKQVEISALNVQLREIQPRISDMKIKMLETGVDVGPLVYTSKVLDVPMDTVANWFTLLLIFLFDPLAIALIIAFNKSWEEDTGRSFEDLANEKMSIDVVKQEDDDSETEYKDIIKKLQDEVEELKKPPRIITGINVPVATGVGETSATDVIERTTPANAKLDTIQGSVYDSKGDPEIQYGHELEEEIYVEPLSNESEEVDEEKTEKTEEIDEEKAEEIKEKVEAIFDKTEKEQEKDHRIVTTTILPEGGVQRS